MKDVRRMSDESLRAEYDKPRPKNRATYKIEHLRANRHVAVGEELARRGLISDPLTTLISELNGGK